jgi:lipopolysaccharide biosynthesis glycosyltransferase
MATGSVVDVHVLDCGISQTSKSILSRLAERFGQSVRVEFLPVDDSVFRGAALGPYKSHMAYCRILLPRVLDASRVVYLDCDVLVFRDLSDLFELPLSSGKILAAVRDSETQSLGDDCRVVADAMKLPAQGAYFNSGVMLMDLDELRKQNFPERSSNFWKRGADAIGFGTSRPSTFFFTAGLTSCPSIGIERPGSLTSRRRMIWVVLHYTRRRTRS